MVIGHVDSAGRVTMRHTSKTILFSGQIANAHLIGTWVIPADVDYEARGSFDLALDMSK